MSVKTKKIILPNPQSCDPSPNKKKKFEELIEESNPPKVGSIFYHYKDKKKKRPFRVERIALRSESHRPTVIYTCLFGSFLTWDRLVSSWNAKVLVDGVKVPRFSERIKNPDVQKSEDVTETVKPE